MVVRIVKMEFRKEEIKAFIALFEARKEQIRNFPGCTYLELLQGTEAKDNIFVTYSYWETEEDLNAYRYSDLFKQTWAQTKRMFARKPEAISFKKQYVLD